MNENNDKGMQRLIDIDEKFCIDEKLDKIKSIIEEREEEKINAVIKNSIELNSGNRYDYYAEKSRINGDMILSVYFYTGNDTIDIEYNINKTIELNTVEDYDEDSLNDLAEGFEKLAIRCRELAIQAKEKR